jgi:hypothetical protein
LGGAILAGVCRGFDVWQTMPDAPNEAWADGVSRRCRSDQLFDIAGIRVVEHR